MLKIKMNIAEALSEAIKKYFSVDASANDIYELLEYPPDKEMGDIALPCFKLSKTLRKAPPVIAQSLSDLLSETFPDGVGKITSSGGYLNFTVSDSYLSDSLLCQILDADKQYGSSDVGKGRTVVLDYSSPNVAKPFHIGHLGTTVIGHSLKKLHEFAGYKCIGINHLGDWGTQFGKLITAYRMWGSYESIEKGGIDELVSLYVKFHDEAEIHPELNDNARIEFTKLENGDKENLKLWHWFVDISLKEYKKTYRQLDIEFDSYKGESFYTDKMPEQVERLREKNLLKIDDGASIVDLEEYGMPPCLILKRGRLYALSDA